TRSKRDWSSDVCSSDLVEITADALEDQVFEGVVDKVSINGTTTNGFTNYPVTIIIEDYGDLKPGMNVSAEIIGEEIPNALCIPRSEERRVGKERETDGG